VCVCGQKTAVQGTVGLLCPRDCYDPLGLSVMPKSLRWIALSYNSIRMMHFCVLCKFPNQVISTGTLRAAFTSAIMLSLLLFLEILRNTLPRQNAKNVLDDTSSFAFFSYFLFKVVLNINNYFCLI